MTAEPAVKLIRPQDVARMLGVSTPQVYHLATEGKIASYKLGRCLRFDQGDVMAYIREQRRERKTG